MAASYYFLLGSLPHAGEFGSAPPVTTQELLSRVADDDAAAESMRALLLGDDLIQREAVLAGELPQGSPVVLTEAQLRDDEPLPDYLVIGAEAPIAADSIWSAYFHHAAETARRAGGTFLGEWIAREVALRNALAQQRAKVLGLDAGKYLVATELGDRDADFTAVVNEWSSASDPLVGLEIIDRNRWDWLSEHDGWFDFDLDELAAYAAKVMLLQRWRRMARAGQASPDGGG